MTPEEQRIAIAEACGYERESFKAPLTGSNITWWYRYKGKEIEQKINESDLPDYLNDLNAMHEAEKTLSNKEFRDVDNFTETERSRYCSILEHVVTGAPKWSVFECYNATAAQRAEAFLKTIGKWVD